MAAPTLKTKRLLLRPWRDADRAPFAEMNADREVMQHIGPTMTRGESDALLNRIIAGFNEHPFGLWAVEVPGVAPFVGFVGLSVPRFEAHFTPCVEIGWRLVRLAWGVGYASEAARAALEHGFEKVGLAEIVSFTTTGNERSQAVMRRIGMHRDPADDFDHPALVPGSQLRRHVLYRLRADEWAAAKA